MWGRPVSGKTSTRPNHSVREVDSGNVEGAEIRVVDISHSFVNDQSGERTVALEHIDLTIARGEFIAVVGPSGCGKSTLLKLIAGLMSPTEGAIYCDERPVRGPGPDRGVVFQDLGLLPWRTVRRNIAHGLEIQRIDRKTRDETVARFVDLMGLSGFEDSYPHQLSGGMRQRVAVARTWASSPKVVLMDEPFAAVDAQTRITLQEELLRISVSSNATLFLITHNVDEAVFLGDRVIVMSKRPGRIKLSIDVPVSRANRSLDQLAHGEMARTAEQVLEAVREEVRTP